MADDGWIYAPDRTPETPRIVLACHGRWGPMLASCRGGTWTTDLSGVIVRGITHWREIPPMPASHVPEDVQYGR